MSIKHITEIFEEKPEMFCPNCGNKGLWKELPGPFCDEDSHLCTKCDHWISISGMGSALEASNFFLNRIKEYILEQKKNFLKGKINKLD